MNHNGSTNLGFVFVIAFVAMHVCADFFYYDDDVCEKCEVSDKNEAYNHILKLAGFSDDYFKVGSFLYC